MAALIGEVSGENDVAVTGTAKGDKSTGVYGESESWAGVWGESEGASGVVGMSSDQYSGGVYGENTGQGIGVIGKSEKNTGVYGESEAWAGVWGQSAGASGVVGVSTGEFNGGVYGENRGKGWGVYGKGIATGVFGKGETWIGVYGESESTTGGSGVWGEHKGNGAGVVGKSADGSGVRAASDNREGVYAETQSANYAAVVAYNLNPDGVGAALYAKKAGDKGDAGFFEGDVQITRSLRAGGDVHVAGNLTTVGDILLANADCAEDFDITPDISVEPGTVMVIGDNGALHQSDQAYDRRVAGVISGAGSYRPGIILDKQGSQPDRRPVALLGKVYCKVDADQASIRVGDLLTTAPTPGFAMKATDPLKAFGAVIGKALQPLDTGQGLLPILIALQ